MKIPPTASEIFLTRVLAGFDRFEKSISDMDFLRCSMSKTTQAYVRTPRSWLQILKSVAEAADKAPK